MEKGVISQEEWKEWSHEEKKTNSISKNKWDHEEQALVSLSFSSFFMSNEAKCLGKDIKSQEVEWNDTTLDWLANQDD